MQCVPLSVLQCQDQISFRPCSSLLHQRVGRDRLPRANFKHFVWVLLQVKGSEAGKGAGKDLDKAKAEAKKKAVRLGADRWPSGDAANDSSHEMQRWRCAHFSESSVFVCLCVCACACVCVRDRVCLGVCCVCVCLCLHVCMCVCVCV